MWLHFKSAAGNRLSIEIEGALCNYRLFKNDWGGLRGFWQLTEINFSSSDIPCYRYDWYMNEKMSRVIPMTWYDNHIVDLSLQVTDEKTINGRMFIQSLQDFYQMTVIRFLYNIDEGKYEIISARKSNKQQIQTIWEEFNIGEVSRYLITLEYLYGRYLPYYQPSSLFVQAKTYNGKVFFLGQTDFDKVEAERMGGKLRQIFESTARVRCWQSKEHFEKKFMPKFVKNFGVIRRFPSRCFVYANYNTSFDVTDIHLRYFIYLGVEKHTQNINEIIKNWNEAIPPQLLPLFGCLLELPTDKKKIRALCGLLQL